MSNPEIVKDIVASNLKKYRKDNGYTQKELAEKLGVRHNTISAWESGTNSIDVDSLYNICIILGVPINAMYGTENAPLTKYIQVSDFTDAETDLITKYRTLDNYGKNTVNVVIDSEHTRCASDTDTKVIKVIPLADFSLSAGTGMELLGDTYDMIEIDGNKYGKADIAFTVKGDSMQPDYNDGDLVYIRKQPTVDVGSIGAFLYGGKQYIKKLIRKDGVYMLHSLNPKYEDIEIKDELITYGKVLN